MKFNDFFLRLKSLLSGFSQNWGCDFSLREKIIKQKTSSFDIAQIVTRKY